jgi:cytochrome c oxidase subunit 3
MQCESLDSNVLTSCSYIIMKYLILNPFHLVEPSPWPLSSSIALLMLTLGSVGNWHGYINSNLSLLGLILLLIIMGLWWRDTVRESTFQGYHTKRVQKGINIGFMLFIVSEVFFFISIFWAFFHSSLSPSIELGSLWPPKGLEALNAWEVPLANTFILLSSGASLTWCHQNLISRDTKTNIIIPLIITLLLALFFTSLQALEYKFSPFTFADGVFGSCFFFATGFHGLHIIIGTTFLLICLLRFSSGHFSSQHHIGLESAIIYWHFVDVIWLFLFVFIYWWGS